MKSLGNFYFTTVQMFPFTGLFHRSISQSGTANSAWAVNPKGRPKAIAELVAELFACHANQSERFISCLRIRDAYMLYDAQYDIKVSCHKHTKNVMKLNSDTTRNYHVEHSSAGNTN
jgi:hypothetical protein